jgi:nitrile hydratase accessory protein
MDWEADRHISNMDGEQALPRSNGELVFEAPWEGRAFGVAVRMNEDRHYEWKEFVDVLIDEIAVADREGVESTYYERWIASLEKLAVAKGLVTAEELDARTEEYRSGARDDEGHGH